MNTNTINAQKMLSFINRPEPVVVAPRKKVPAKKAPVVEDYPYETESSDSEVEVIEKPKKKKVVAKKEVKPQAAVALPQPAPPAAMAALAAPVVDAPKEKKVRAKKEKVAEVPVAAVAQGGSTGDSNLSAKKQKRAPSLYNKFASEKMKSGMSMKDVASAWKAEKAKGDAKA